MYQFLRDMADEYLEDPVSFFSGVWSESRDLM